MKDQSLIRASAWVSLLLVTALLYPLKVVSVKMQIKTKRTKLVEYLKWIFRDKRILLMYKHVLIDLINSALSFIAYVLSFHWIKKAVASKTRNFEVIENLLISLASQLTMKMLTQPIWTIHTRLVQDNSKTFSGVFNQMKLNERWFSLFSGFSMSILLMAKHIEYYFIHSYLKYEYRPKDTLGFLVIEGSAKALSSMLTYPLATIRARIQTRKAPWRLMFIELLEILIKVLKFDKSGLTTLYNGVVFNMIANFLSPFLLYTLNNKILRLLESRENKYRVSFL